jgi:ribosome biogenesis protein UTP30
MPKNKVNVFNVFKKRKRNAPNVSTVQKKGGPTKSLVSIEQIQRAVKALTNYVEREKSAKKRKKLIQEEETISLIITLFKTPEKGQNKGIAIPIPHTLFPAAETRICLFVKDDAVKSVKKRLSDGQILKGGVDKVIGLTKLRKNYNDHQRKRELCNSYELFLADDRILPMLSKPLGREFFKRKKQPRPVRVMRKKLEAQITRARDSTRLYLGWGNCSAVRIARTDMTQSEIVQNIIKGINEIVRHIPMLWKGIQALHLKTPDSLALPLYAHAPAFDAIDSGSESTSTEQVISATNGKNEASPKKRR